MRWRARVCISPRGMLDAKEILWKDLVGLQAVTKVERGPAMGEVVLEMSLRIAALESVSRRVKYLARWEELLGEVSRSVVNEGGSLTVVSQMAGWAGGSVREGSMEIEVMGGICKEVDTVGLRVTEAIREVEMEV
jgi:hypothetical protein